MPKVSIIVPVYKVEKYLSRCIESILNQTFHDFELILVDDGSPDSSGKICDEYAQKDNRVIVIHKQNGGVSSARNTGIDNALSEYIMFVDSDDYIVEDMLEKMIGEANNTTDLVIASIKMVCKEKEFDFKMENNIYLPQELMEDFCLEKFPRICVCGPWCKMYSLDIIKRNNVRFDLSLNLGEDTHFNMQYIIHCKKIVSISDLCYYYMRDNEESLFTKFRDYYYDNGVEVYKAIIGNATAFNCSTKAIENYIKIYLSELISNIYKSIKTADKDTSIDYMKKMSTNVVLVNNHHLLKYRRNLYFKANMVLKKHFSLLYYMNLIWIKFIRRR